MREPIVCEILCASKRMSIRLCRYMTYTRIDRFNIEFILNSTIRNIESGLTVKRPAVFSPPRNDNEDKVLL